MERVATLLAGSHFRQALVRLWVIGSHTPALNEWEQARGNDATFDAAVAHFLIGLQNEQTITTAEILAAPLALIRALDEFAALHRAPGLDAAHCRNSDLAFKEAGRNYWLVPVALQARREVSLAKQVGNLQTWFRHHAVLPCVTVHGINVSVSVSEGSLDAALAALRDQAAGELTVWIAHFTDDADVQWSREQGTGRNWRTTHIDPPDVRQQSMLEAVEAAVQTGAHVLVFPEFTIDLQHRRALEEYLLRREPTTLWLVVAGSFHEPVPADQSHVAYNTAPVYDGTGEVLFAHRKLRIFGDLDKGAENVDLGNALHVLVTPLGCMSVLICKDFMDEHPTVRTLLTELPVDWAFVPSYGDDTTLKAHKNRAQVLATVSVGTNTVVAQTQNTAMAQAGVPPPHLPGFGHAAGSKDPSTVDASGGLVRFPLRVQPRPATSKSQPTLTRVK
ncbi:MAG: hypothetical protein LH632_15235 [Rhodoferax sp.]|nr:hypothetical protein [Rhodoferax sp.]